MRSYLHISVYDMFYLQVDATTEINSDDAFAIEKVSTKHKYNDLYSMVYL